MIVTTLEDVKAYIILEHDEDDALLTELTNTAEHTVMYVGRLSEQELIDHSEITKTAVHYAAAYLYEHRENADHNQLALTLRALLSGIRKEVF